MVDVLGHLGMALIWLSPSWVFIDHQRTAAAFIAVGFWFGMLPDVDLVLSALPGIHHHGVFHTVLFVTIAAVTVGPLLGWAMKRVLGGTSWFSDRAESRAYLLGAIAVWITGLAHVFADMLSAPDTSTRIEPLWPLVEGPIVYMDVLYYKSFWATIALFVGGLVANALFWYLSRRRSDTPSRSTATR
jgi:hypothetical protein